MFFVPCGEKRLFPLNNLSFLSCFDDFGCFVGFGGFGWHF